MECAEEMVKPDDKIEPLTEKQKKDIAGYYQAHPEETLTENPDLCEMVERLCESLRELRRETPEKFFGQPVEALYERLEAALACFYKARVSEEGQELTNDPRGS